MIEIHLYGKLRLHFRDSIYREGDVLRVYPDPGETLTSVLPNAYSLELSSSSCLARTSGSFVGAWQVLFSHT